MSDTEILNLISDLRANNEELEEEQKRLIKLKDEVEGLEDDIASLKISIDNDRERLDDLIDEATGRAEEKPEYPSYAY